MLKTYQAMKDVGIPSGYSAIFYYVDRDVGKVIGYPVIYQGETHAVKQGGGSSANTRSMSVYYPQYAPFQTDYQVTIQHKTPQDKNGFGHFIRKWQKHTLGGFEPLTFRFRKNENRDVDWFKCVVGSVQVGASYNESTTTQQVTVTRISKSQEDINLVQISDFTGTFVPSGQASTYLRPDADPDNSFSGGGAGNISDLTSIEEGSTATIPAGTRSIARG